MCIICIDLIKQNMTLFEAERNAIELGALENNVPLSEHYRKLYAAIDDLDLEAIERLLNETQ